MWHDNYSKPKDLIQAFNTRHTENIFQPEALFTLKYTCKQNYVYRGIWMNPSVPNLLRYSIHFLFTKFTNFFFCIHFTECPSLSHLMLLLDILPSKRHGHILVQKLICFFRHEFVSIYRWRLCSGDLDRLIIRSLCNPLTAYLTITPKKAFKQHLLFWAKVLKGHMLTRHYTNTPKVWVGILQCSLTQHIFRLVLEFQMVQWSFWEPSRTSTWHPVWT